MSDDLTDGEFDRIFESLEEYRQMCIELPDQPRFPEDYWWFRKFRADTKLVLLPGAQRRGRKQQVFLDISQVC